MKVPGNLDIHSHEAESRLRQSQSDRFNDEKDSNGNSHAKDAYCKSAAVAAVKGTGQTSFTLKHGSQQF